MLALIFQTNLHSSAVKELGGLDSEENVTRKGVGLDHLTALNCPSLVSYLSVLASVKYISSTYLYKNEYVPHVMCTQAELCDRHPISYLLWSNNIESLQTITY
jgi:hypothetical protein